MKHDLIVGVFITAISYGVLFLYCVVRNVYREHLAVVEKEKQAQRELECLRQIPAWDGYKSEQTRLDAIAEQNRLVSLGHLVDGVLSKIQLDVFKLSKELSEFLVRLGPEPTIDPVLANSEADDRIEYALKDMYVRQTEWESRFQAEYALSFRDRVDQTVNLLAVKGLSDAELTMLTKNEHINDEAVRDVRNRLIQLAMKIDDPPFAISRCDEAGKMLWGFAGTKRYSAAYNYDPDFRRAADKIALRIKH